MVMTDKKLRFEFKEIIIPSFFVEIPAFNESVCKRNYLKTICLEMEE